MASARPPTYFSLHPDTLAHLSIDPDHALMIPKNVSKSRSNQVWSSLKQGWDIPRTTLDQPWFNPGTTPDRPWIGPKSNVSHPLGGGLRPPCKASPGGATPPPDPPMALRAHLRSIWSIHIRLLIRSIGVHDQ